MHHWLRGGWMPLLLKSTPDPSGVEMDRAGFQVSIKRARVDPRGQAQTHVLSFM